jgi:hypothetical protein
MRYILILWFLLIAIPCFAQQPPPQNNDLLGNGFLGPATKDAYGPGINSDATGRPFTWQPQRGYGKADPFIDVKPNVYGPGIGQDQYGRPVKPRRR